MIDFTPQVKIAIKELVKNSRKTKKKRVTRLVRLGTDWYEKIKASSKAENKTISKTLDDVCRYFYKSYMLSDVYLRNHQIRKKDVRLEMLHKSQIGNEK